MDQSEFLSVVFPFKDRLFRMAKRLLISSEEAQDATQEVLLKLWTKKASLQTYTSIEALAITMTKNYCLDQLKSKRANTSSISSVNYEEKQADLHQKLEGKDSLVWVEKIISQLPDQQKIIIQLREIEQMEFAEIAKILEMNEAAIRVNLSRARKTIRENYKKINSYGVD